MITRNFRFQSFHLISICCSGIPRPLGRSIATNLDVDNLVTGLIRARFRGAGRVLFRCGVYLIGICASADRLWGRFSRGCSGFRTRTANDRFPCRCADRRLYRDKTHGNRTSPMSATNSEMDLLRTRRKEDLVPARAKGWNGFPLAAACQAAATEPAVGIRYFRAAKLDVPGAASRTAWGCKGGERLGCPNCG